MRKLYTCILFFVCGVVSKLSAQDPHFTQLMNTASALNPAAAGFGVEYIRATLLYRNQWASVKSPFTTQSLFFDKAVNRAGFGFNVINNTAGDAGIRQLHLNGNLAYTVSAGSNRFTGGIQLGLINKSFDP